MMHPSGVWKEKPDFVDAHVFVFADLFKVPVDVEYKRLTFKNINMWTDMIFQILRIFVKIPCVLHEVDVMLC